jgi:hypothetical protein
MRVLSFSDRCDRELGSRGLWRSISHGVVTEFSKERTVFVWFFFFWCRVVAVWFAFSRTLVWLTLKGCPRTVCESPEREWRYSSTLSLTSALERGGWLLPRRGRFTPWKEILYPSNRKLVGLDGCGKSRPLPGFNPRTLQPVGTRYTDWAILAHIMCLTVT